MLPGRKEVESKNTAERKSFLSVWWRILKGRRGGGGGWRLKVGGKNRKREQGGEEEKRTH